MGRRGRGFLGGRMVVFVVGYRGSVFVGGYRF